MAVAVIQTAGDVLPRSLQLAADGFHALSHAAHGVIPSRDKQDGHPVGQVFEPRAAVGVLGQTDEIPHGADRKGERA